MHKEKINDSGSLYSTTLGGITCYDIFTFAGKYRGGKIYFSDKVFIILSGSCELTTLESGEDITRVYTPKSGIVTIPSGVANIFYFTEDTRMLEWFPENTKIEKYDRYRQMK